jgi:hypothetical protein
LWYVADGSSAVKVDALVELLVADSSLVLGVAHLDGDTLVMAEIVVLVVFEDDAKDVYTAETKKDCSKNQGSLHLSPDWSYKSCSQW